MNSINKSVTDAGWATICSGKVLDFTPTPVVTDDDMKAYIITGVDADGTTLLTRQVLGKVAPNTGLIIHAQKGTCYIHAHNSQDGETYEDLSANKLIGVLEDTPVPPSIYVLLNETEGIGFYKTNNTFTVTGGTAYLPADIVGSDVKGLSIAFDDSTGIKSIENNDELNANGWYDLSGRRIEGKPSVSGIYINNRRKIVIK